MDQLHIFFVIILKFIFTHSVESKFSNWEKFLDTKTTAFSKAYFSNIILSNLKSGPEVK